MIYVLMIIFLSVSWTIYFYTLRNIKFYGFIVVYYYLLQNSLKLLTTYTILIFIKQNIKILGPPFGPSRPRCNAHLCNHVVTPLYWTGHDMVGGCVGG